MPATHITRPIPRLARRRPLARFLALLGLRRERRRLALLDSHMLRDIGLSRDEALREAERPVWDVPAHWRR